MKRRELVDIFLGSDLEIYTLPIDLLYVILEIAGLAKYGRSMSYFSIYFSPFHKWHEKPRRKDEKES